MLTVVASCDSYAGVDATIDVEFRGRLNTNIKLLPSWNFVEVL